MAFEKKLTPQQLAKFRQRFLELPDISHDDRARIVAKETPEFAENTLRQYSRLCLQTTEKVFNLFLEEKISQAVLSELCAWDPKDQDFIIDEYLDKKFTPEILRRIRRYRKENGWSYDECIGRATGQIDPTAPRKENRKGLDTLLTEIADKGARWRAMVEQVLAMIGEEEANAGVHEALFTKVVLLRELIGTQYDYVNSRFNRYINLIRKRVQTGEPSSPAMEAIEEGERNGDRTRAGERRFDREEGAHHEDGPPVPNPADEA